MHTEGPRPALSPRQGHDAGREAAPLAGAAQARGQVKASAATPGVASCSRHSSEDPRQGPAGNFHTFGQLMEKDEKLQGVNPRQHETWEVNKRRYARVTGPSINKRLWQGRAKLMTVYLKTPQVFPNGPDGRAWGLGAWYVTSEWGLDERGEAVRTVTESIPVTESHGVTESPVAPVTESLPEGVRRGMGRPKKDGSLSAKERMRRLREKRRGS